MGILASLLDWAVGFGFSSFALAAKGGVCPSAVTSSDSGSSGGILQEEATPPVTAVIPAILPAKITRRGIRQLR